jgi:hypothetical protein
VEWIILAQEALIVGIIYDFGFHKRLKFLDELGKNQLLKRGSVP